MSVATASPIKRPRQPSFPRAPSQDAAGALPLAGEIRRMAAGLAAPFAEPGAHVYDIGCGTGEMLLALDAALDPAAKLFGADGCPEKLAEARRMTAARGTRPVGFLPGSPAAGLHMENAGAVTMLFSLQPVHPLRRRDTVQAVRRAMNPHGALVVVEQVSCRDATLGRFFAGGSRELAHGNGFAEARVPAPYRPDETLSLLQEAGFRSAEVFFRWYDYCGFIAVC